MGGVVAPPESEAIAEAAAILADARHVVALTGAGISKESGIPTYRGDGGLWTVHGEPPLNQYETFVEDPQRWWERRLADTQNDFALALERAGSCRRHASGGADPRLDRCGRLSL